jgi:hypothetical protein
MLLCPIKKVFYPDQFIPNHGKLLSFAVGNHGGFNNTAFSTTSPESVNAAKVLDEAKLKVIRTCWGICFFTNVSLKSKKSSAQSYPQRQLLNWRGWPEFRDCTSACQNSSSYKHYCHPPSCSNDLAPHYNLSDFQTVSGNHAQALA